MMLRVMHIRERRGNRGPDELVSAEEVDDDRLGEAIGADNVDIHHRRVGPERREYLIICDDVGRIKERDPTAVAMRPNGPMVSFVGDILVCREHEGELASITPEDEAYLRSSLAGCFYGRRFIYTLEVDR